MTVERFGQYSSSRSFAHAARASEQIRVMDATAGDRIAERAAYGFLSNYLIERLGAKPSCYYL